MAAKNGMLIVPSGGLCIFPGARMGGEGTVRKSEWNGALGPAG